MTLPKRQSLLERAAEVYDFAEHARARGVPAEALQPLAPIAPVPPAVSCPVPAAAVPPAAAIPLRAPVPRPPVGTPRWADIDDDQEPGAPWRPTPVVAPVEELPRATPVAAPAPVFAPASAAEPLPDLSAIPAEFLADPTVDPDEFVPPPLPAGIAQIDRGMLAENGFIVPGAPVGPLAEEFRLVKRQLLVTSARIAASDEPDKARTILVCSARPLDGKTFCAVNLALSMAAERDTEVLLVDADVAKPDALRQLGLADGPGLLDALADASIDVESLVIRTDVPNLSVLPAGARSASDTEMLASARTRAVIARLLAANPRRLVIFDSPPALAASPAAVLAMLVGQVMLVVRADRTPENEIAEAADLLDGCEHIQLMLNATTFVPGAHRFGSYYGMEDRS